MSKKEDIKEEEITTQKSSKLQIIKKCREVVKEEPTAEELIQKKKISFYVFLQSLRITKKEQQRTNRIFKTAGQEVMTSLLPVVDDFERALSHIEEDKEAEELRKGV